jgi:hypothetical protein
MDDQLQFVKTLVLGVEKVTNGGGVNHPTERDTTMKKKTRAKPKAKLKDLKAKRNPKGGGIIVHDRKSGGSPDRKSGGSPDRNHNETLVSSAV